MNKGCKGWMKLVRIVIGIKLDNWKTLHENRFGNFDAWYTNIVFICQLFLLPFKLNKTMISCHFVLDKRPLMCFKPVKINYCSPMFALQTVFEHPCDGDPVAYHTKTITFTRVTVCSLLSEMKIINPCGFLINRVRRM